MNSILLDFPDSFESERLMIRCPRPGDSAKINEAIRESFEELHRWMPWAKTLPLIDDTERCVRSAHAQFLTRETLPLILLSKDSGEFVGSSGLHNIDWDVPRFEIGYWLRTSRTGQGWMTEEVASLIYRLLQATCEGNTLREESGDYNVSDAS